MTNLGGSIAAIWALVVLWTGRANNAWGASRVWNSGTSFESAYTTEVGLYNASQASLASVTADRDTWQARANAAWGDSGVWSSGTSFQNQRPTASPIVWSGSLSGSIGASASASLSVSETSDPSGIASASGTTITVSKAGTYVVFAMAHSSSQQFTDSAIWRLNVLKNGVSQTLDATGDTTPVNGGSGSGNSRTHAVARVTLAASDTITIQGTNTSGFGAEALADGFVELVFIPTLSNPN
jgi:hypothetical protein